MTEPVSYTHLDVYKRQAEVCSNYGVHYYPIISSARAFRALWKRAYFKFRDWMGGVVYEDPWLAGGHNGLSNSEDPLRPEAPFPRVFDLRKQMREYGLDSTPIVMAGGVWNLKEWEDWIDNADLGPVGFQFGTRPLLTKESPISDAWKRKLLTLKEGDVFLNHFSPTGFYSSAVRNRFLNELRQRSDRQVAYSVESVGDHLAPLEVGARSRVVYLTCLLYTSVERLAVQILGADMAVARLEQQPGQRQALPRRPQISGTQAFQGIGEGTGRAHARHMVISSDN